MRNDLQNRLFNFAVRALKFLSRLQSTTEFTTICYQLSKSSTSSGANHEEAQAGSSKADFTNKVRIALREMRESNYWLRIIKAIDENSNDYSELFLLIQESEELKKILGSIVTKSKT